MWKAANKTQYIHDLTEPNKIEGRDMDIIEALQEKLTENITLRDKGLRAFPFQQEHDKDAYLYDFHSPSFWEFWA